uniref:Src kinase-associated phosphoprotein 2 n=1 Tax=Eptatretus burgeri TaxID=7764 RepID=A0A8C4NE24_EPTBU
MQATCIALVTVLQDCVIFLEDLKNENLSKKVKDRREALIKDIKQATRYCDFHDVQEIDSCRASPVYFRDEVSIASGSSDCTTGQITLPVAASCLTDQVMAGYLEKKKKEHSVFGTEWQKRYCIISSNTFYVYGNKKDKQQKEAFILDDASSVHRSIGMRRDSKRDCCFEIADNENSTHKFAASSLEAANEWVETIKTLLQGYTASRSSGRDSSVAAFTSSIQSMQDHREELHSEDILYDDVGTNPNVPADLGQEAPDLLEDDDLPPPPSFLLDGLCKPEPVIPDKEYNYRNFYQALWNCTADKEDELSFKRGDLIYVLSKEFDALRWWIGEMDNTIGLVPKSYLTEAYEL